MRRRLSTTLFQLALGAREDLRSLPARLREPDRWRDPWAVRLSVGGGDHRMMGEHLAQLLDVHGGLQPDWAVLDVGCGNGRVAEALQRRLGPAGRYHGFDVSAAGVAHARRRFRGDARFTFARIDVANAMYNPGGRMAEAEAVFPADGGAFDLVFATSLFTHLRGATARRYLREAARCLRPGGRLLATVYALDGESLAALADGAARLRFQPLGPEEMTTDPRLPEGGVAQAREALERWLAEAGLQFEGLLPGVWRGAEGPTWQDTLLAARPA